MFGFTGMISAALLVVVFNIMTTAFDGIVVARLPFEPFPFMRRITHAGLPGEDWTECSAAFIYVACSVGIRANLQKLLGWAPARLPNKNGSSIMDKMK